MPFDSPDTQNTLTRALPIAVQAATDAADFIQENAGKVHDADIQEKGINDLASFVDEGAQDRIMARIEAEFSEHRYLAEEGFEERGESLQDSEGWLWIIDPLDGTTNFMHGVPQYGVSIGLLYSGDPVLAVVRDVCRGETFSAIKGRGVRIDLTPCTVSKTPTLAQSLITTGFPYKQFDYINGYTEVIRAFWTDSRGVRRPGSASLDLAWVAAGRFDGFFEQGIEPWDVAAGVLLVTEAGGRYTDFSDRTMDDPESMRLGSEICASNGLIHREMIDRLGPLRTADAAK